MLTREFKNTIVNSFDGSPHGIQATFIRLTEVLGVKVYRNRQARDHNFNVAYKAWQNGFGPLVCECIDIGPKRFGFFSEIVEVLDVIKMRELGICSVEYQAIKNEWLVRLEKCGLVDADNAFYDTFGGMFMDSHVFNYGIKNGKTLIIDCGEVDKGNHINTDYSSWGY